MSVEQVRESAFSRLHIRLAFSPKHRTRFIASAGALSVVASVLGVAANGSTAVAASTGPTTLFQQTFTTDTISPANGAISFPAAPASTNNPGGVNSACLTVAQAASSPLPNCATTPDVSGSGALQLTANSNAQEGGIFAATSVPASQGLDVTFNSYQYGGTGADGITFVLGAVDPTNPLSPPVIGQAGGSLGYSATGGLPGLADGYLGIGLDTYGNFSSKRFEGSGCESEPAVFTSASPNLVNHVAVRGPGHDTVGYCGLAAGGAGEKFDVPGSAGGTRANSLIPVEVVINTTADPFTTTNGSLISVSAGQWAVVYKPIGAASWKVVNGPLPTVSPTFYGADTSSWIDSNHHPRQLAFGWVASTGGSKDTHEINAVKVTSIDAVPKLRVVQTVQDVATAVGGPTTVPQGSPVTYTVTPSVDASGADENSPVTVTDTLPDGVTPTSASGNGWVCDPPSGQKISCTNSNTPFAAGTSLPPLTIDGTVTDPSGVSESTIETNTITTASSADANPGYSASAGGSVPAAALSGLTISPSRGGAGDPAKISGTGLDVASQVDIGTTHFPLCPGAAAAGCFTYNSTSGDIEISAMPSHAVGATTVTVIDGGSVSNAMTYTYFTAPAAPTVTAASHDDGHVTISWTPGSDNEATVTSWTITPLLGDGTSSGIAAAIEADETATSYDFAGLTKGTTYKFDVVANTSDAGDGAVGESNTVTPPLDLALTTTSLNVGEVGVAGYSQTLTSTGGTGPLTWSATGLPSGLTLSTSGVLSGTPTVAIDGTVHVVVTDADGATSARDLALTIAANPTITTASLPNVVVNDDSYSQTLAVSDGIAPFSWAVTAGALPTGMTLDTLTGVISGTPTGTTSASFTVSVTDANGKSDSKALTLNVVAPPPPTTMPTPPSGSVDTDTADGTNPTAASGGTSSSGGSDGGRITAAGTGTGELRVSTLSTASQGDAANDPAVSGPTAGGFYNVSLGTNGLSKLVVTISGTPSTSLYWWTGAAWQKVPGVTRDADGNLTVTLSSSTTPNLGQLSNATLAAGATPVTRIAGDARVTTATAVSKVAFPVAGSAQAVVLARDDLFADALTGGPLAAAENAPVLLTNTTSLLPAVAQEIKRVLPAGGTVYLLGQTAALDEHVASAVAALGYHTQRVGGADRYATAVGIAEALGNPTTIFEATGENFPDAMSAAPAAVKSHAAILLTGGRNQSSATARYLATHTVTARYAIGGQAAAADPSAARFVGADRYATAVKVASTLFPDASRVGLATGEEFADALVAAPSLGKTSSPLLLTASTPTLPAPVAGYLKAGADKITSATVFGGTSALSDALAKEFQADTP